MTRPVTTIQRARLLIKGVVQGVGFRPFIYQLAHDFSLNGWVLNSSKGVVIEVEGITEDVNGFIKEIEIKPPPLALIESLECEVLPPAGYESFIIKSSLQEDEKFLLISPDISICDDCLRELFDPKDGRYRYPFINCTNCGPRFTIIEDIPYDREKTTMKKFKMCERCQKEYDDPANRRFHAQPNACADCGPKLTLVRSRELGVGSEEINSDDLVKGTITLLKKGRIVAIKGLGGFHLACDAENDEAISRLRERKRRFGKPLAVMMSDIDTVKKFCFVNEKEEKLLLSYRRPIVLLKMFPSSTISDLVAPNNNYLGVMLPYTPLHYLILKESNMVLVMTSGNLSEEPIAFENDEAMERLGDIADYFLLHDRDVYSRYDDSVARVSDGKEVMIRRARGYAPLPIHLPFESKEILACGPELKNTFCLTKGKHAFISQHIGDMENQDTLEHFEQTLALYKRLFRIEPKIIAYDLHPEYLSTKFAKSLEGMKLIGVQHHHAHIVSCMVENGIEDKVIGVSFDGTGYGTDGTIWGGEFLVADWKSFERYAHLRYVPMPGGEGAIKKPYRMALGYLYSFFGGKIEELDIDFLKGLDEVELKNIRIQIEKDLNSPMTSSCGRFFDAVSALVGVCDVVDYEGQAAIELEMVAQADVDERYDFKLEENSRKTQLSSLIVDTKPIIMGVIDDLKIGLSNSEISAKFHNTVAAFVIAVCNKLREEKGINKVVLSGGVFQNLFLSNKLMRELRDKGFKVYFQRKVPCNDGGISLGQAVIANFSV
ncbi:carbamoyltransferase HypF [Candidatus Oleimmundimicrobium sp.]|uniref:carbamoyltransferase HypF n=1 Tax=Candidatus Oleimmundimicrobium sp. TaxID=3060597 RepID=UPI002715EAC9|nr:carbamoyltransferase HypF [Candidatus Oleimmundimicrobium sp.]MDO8885629.1 carbamoyltransferase HypF [Candidatus Oleimmundimicrobium sp.]